MSAIILKNVLKSCDVEKEDIHDIAENIQLVYEEYMQERPSAKKYFQNSIVWLDAILFKISMESKSIKCIAGNYELLRNVRELLNRSNPYSNCTQYQQGILSDIFELKNTDNETLVNNIIDRNQSEFIRLQRDIRKNERSNKLSLMIGILGIAVSVLLAIIKF